MLDLQHDVYLGIYFASVLALFTAYARTTRLDLRSMLVRHWKLGALIGLLFGVALVRNVLGEPPPRHAPTLPTSSSS